MKLNIYRLPNRFVTIIYEEGFITTFTATDIQHLKHFYRAIKTFMPQFFYTYHLRTAGSLPENLILQSDETNNA